MNNIDIDKIINESINKVILQEKIRKGKKQFVNHEEEQKISPTATRQVFTLISNLFKNDFLNVSAFAQYVFPDHTPEGAQSHLRKALDGLDNEGKKSKNPIRFTGRMAEVILKLISQIVQV